MKDTLNLFYEEPDPDRWVKFDRYPRRVVRRLVRGPAPIGGVQRLFLNLIHGLDIIGQPYTINNYSRLKKDKESLALVVGKPHVINKIPAGVKIIYGAAVASHPSDTEFGPLLNRLEHLLVPGEWIKLMYERDMHINLPVTAWPSGIETEVWKPDAGKQISNTVLVYDKIRWEYPHYKSDLLDPIVNKLEAIGKKVIHIKYGSYKEDDFKALLKTADAMVFLCEHETQGFAYLQALSNNVPILAWNRGGFWKDPAFYPEIKFGPVTSVPYWDERCGVKFKDVDEFEQQLLPFFDNLKDFNPRDYILENLTLEACAQRYVDIYKKVSAQLSK